MVNEIPSDNSIFFTPEGIEVQVLQGNIEVTKVRILMLYVQQYLSSVVIVLYLFLNLLLMYLYMVHNKHSVSIH